MMTTKLAFWVLVGLSVIDALLTALILKAGGAEANPFMAWHIATFGLMGLVYGKIPGLLSMGVIVHGLWERLSPPARKWTHGFLVFVLGAMVVLAGYSSTVLYNLTR